LRDFFNELNRRRVVRSAAIYVVVGWLVIQAAETLAPLLLLPGWVARAVVFVVLLGFPLALVFAWIFDVTPGGVRRTGRTPGRAGRRRGGKPTGAVEPSRLLLLVAGAALLVAVAGVAAYGWLGSDPAPAGADGRLTSIAVLPFADMSPDGDQEYFSDGITEELLNALARIPGLQVAARTSSFAFKGQSLAMEEIGEKLRVQAVLEGSVRRDGDRLRITAQLIDAATGYHLWSETYDRRLAGVFDIQDEISRAIVAALQVRFAGTAVQGPRVQRSTSDVEAHNLYLRGLHLANRRRAPDLHRAIAYFQQAIDLDPQYAAPYAGTATAWIVLPNYDTIPMATAVQRALPPVQRALDLDPDLPEAHGVRALIAMFQYAWPAADQGFQRALELNPAYSTGLVWYSQFLASQGRMDEALRLARRALDVDPLSVLVNNNLGFIHLFRREYDLAITQLRSTLELDSTFSSALSNLVAAYRGAGRYDDAIEVHRWQAAAFAVPFDQAAAVTLTLSGRQDRNRTLHVLEDMARERRPNSFLIAVGYAELGEVEEALDWLERAYDERHFNVHYLNVLPALDNVRSAPRFRRLSERMDLPGS
jgi:adenylate cyclase